MKKITMAVAVMFTAAFIFADNFNPPVGGHNLYNISSPTQLTSASSSAGGGIFLAGPDSIAFNPALASREQRVQLDFGFTALVSTVEENGGGAAMQTGILIPTKFFVFSGLVNGVFLDRSDIALADSVNVKTGLSKEISDQLSIGLNINGGVLWGAGSDWALGADIGILYDFGDLGFLKDFRLGVSELNLGKYYNNVAIPGVKGNDIPVNFPSLATTKVGVAALLFRTKQFRGGFSFDLTTPCFTNLIVDAGLQFSFNDMIFLNVAESIDILEASRGFGNFIPAVSLGIKFNFNAKNSEYLKKHSWDSSEMLATVAWQQRYQRIHAASGGARLYLGQKDTTPPAIQMWVDE